MRKSYFADRFKFLKSASLKIDDLSVAIDNYFISVFKNSDLKFLKSKLLAFSQTISVVKELSTLIFYTVESSVIENNIFTLNKEVSARSLAQISGHSAVRTISSRGTINIQPLANFSGLFGSEIKIANYAKFRTSTGQNFIANLGQDQIIYSSNSNWVVPLIEGVIQVQTFIATGEKLFTINLDDVASIENYEYYVNVNGKRWNRADSLYDQTNNSETYTARSGFINQLDLVFGTGINGKIPTEGSKIDITYLLSSGAAGNIEDTIDPVWQIIDGITDLSDQEIDINDYVLISKSSGFDLGNDSESLETTKLCTGFTSRSLVLANDSNFEAYLSRLPASRIKIIPEYQNSAVKNLLILPNLSNKVRNYKDYYSLDQSDFLITSQFKDSVTAMIESSRRTFVTNEIVWIDPILRKYAALIYIDSDEVIYNTDNLKQTIENVVIQHMISRTFSQTYSMSISKAGIIKDIMNSLGTYLRISIVFFSEQNETAKINQWYTEEQYINSNGIERLEAKRIEVPLGTNPNLGFSEYGDIVVNSDQDIPVLLGDFNILSADQIAKPVTEPLSIYLKTSTGWQLL